MQIGAEAQERLNIINRLAKGWCIAQAETDGLGQGWRIVKTDGLFDIPHTDKDATEFVVSRAWDEDPLCLLALDFLRAVDPFAYTKSIKMAHGSA